MTRLEQMVVRVGPSDLNKLDGLPASFRIAAMLLSRMRKGQIDIVLKDGRTLRFQGDEPGPRAEITVHDHTFARPALSGGDIGFAQAYMDAKFDTPSLADLLEYVTVNFEDAGK